MLQTIARLVVVQLAPCMLAGAVSGVDHSVTSAIAVLKADRV
jgi:hypothetical protein